jgi:hypothetical protein
MISLTVRAATSQNITQDQARDLAVAIARSILSKMTGG